MAIDKLTSEHFIARKFDGGFEVIRKGGLHRLARILRFENGNFLTCLDETHPFNKEELMEIVSFLTSLDADL